MLYAVILLSLAVVGLGWWTWAQHRWAAAIMADMTARLNRADMRLSDADQIHEQTDARLRGHRDEIAQLKTDYATLDTLAQALLAGANNARQARIGLREEVNRAHTRIDDLVKIASEADQELGQRIEALKTDWNSVAEDAIATEKRQRRGRNWYR